MSQAPRKQRVPSPLSLNPQPVPAGPGMRSIIDLTSPTQSVPRAFQVPSSGTPNPWTPPWQAGITKLQESIQQQQSAPLSARQIEVIDLDPKSPPVTNETLQPSARHQPREPIPSNSGRLPPAAGTSRERFPSIPNRSANRNSQPETASQAMPKMTRQELRQASDELFRMAAQDGIVARLPSPETIRQLGRHAAAETILQAPRQTRRESGNTNPIPPNTRLVVPSREPYERYPVRPRPSHGYYSSTTTSTGVTRAPGYVPGPAIRHHPSLPPRNPSRVFSAGTRHVDYVQHLPPTTDPRQNAGIGMGGLSRVYIDERHPNSLHGRQPGIVAGPSASRANLTLGDDPFGRLGPRYHSNLIPGYAVPASHDRRHSHPIGLSYTGPQQESVPYGYQLPSSSEQIALPPGSQYIGTLHQPVPSHIHHPSLLTPNDPRPPPHGRTSLLQSHPFAQGYQPAQPQPRSRPTTPVPSEPATRKLTPKPDTRFTVQQGQLIAKLTREGFKADYIFAKYHEAFPELPRQLNQIKTMRTRVWNGSWMKHMTDSDLGVEDTPQVRKQQKKMEAKTRLAEAKKRYKDLQTQYAELEDDDIRASLELNDNEAGQGSDDGNVGNDDQEEESSGNEGLENLILATPSANELSNRRIWNPTRRDSSTQRKDSASEESDPASPRSGRSDSPRRSDRDTEKSPREIARKQGSPSARAPRSRRGSYMPRGQRSESPSESLATPNTPKKVRGDESIKKLDI